MINEQLLRYVRQQLSQGTSKETISTNLKSQGWDDTDLHEVFTAIGVASAPTPAPIPPIPPVSAVPPVTKPMPNPVAQPQPVSPEQPAPAQFSTIPYSSMMHPASTTNPAPTSSHKGRKVLLAILVIILLGLAGGGAYVYYSGTQVSLSDLSTKAIENNQIETSVADVEVQ